LSPNDPVSGGDFAADASDVPVPLFRSFSSLSTFNFIVNVPTVGEPFGVESTIVMINVSGSIKSPVNADPRLSENIKRSISSVLSATGGSFVGSENFTVMVSPSENPETTGTFESAATIDRIVGPSFVMKVPDSGGDSAKEASDVSAKSLRSFVPSFFIFNLKASARPTSSRVAGQPTPVQLPLSTILIISVVGSVKLPV